MKRTFGIAAILCLALVGSADAGRGRGHHGKHRASNGGVVVTKAKHGRVKHVRVSGGRYVFPGGVMRTYRRPVIRERYYDVHVRPAVVVETYDPVPGYVWVAGQWTWSGREWVWASGYWVVADVEPPPPPVVQGGISVSAGITIR